MNGVEVREERPADAPAVYAVNAAAFETDAEARLVDALRANGGLVLSLVAEVDGRVQGHVAFSDVTVTAADGNVHRGVGLAPVAVAPQAQRQGVGGALIRAGLERLRGLGVPFCVLLGHPSYYPRFGFQPASRFGLRWTRPVRDEAFMALALRDAGLTGVEGTVRYRPELEAL